MAPETRVPPQMQMRFDDWVGKRMRKSSADVQVATPPTQRPRRQDPQQQPIHTPSPSQQRYPAPYPPPYPPPVPQNGQVVAPPDLHSMPHPSELLQRYRQQLPQQQPTPPAQADSSAQSPQADEWTQVMPKGKRKRRSVATQTESESATSKTTAARARNPPSRNMTLAKIQSDFNTKMKAWQASTCRKTTFSTLDRIAPEGGWNLQKAVCLGIGSFARDNEECRKRSMWQFVIFVDLVRHLQRVGKRDVEMFGQEPMWTDVDGHFLTALRLKVLETDKPNEGNQANESSIRGLGSAAEHLASGTFVYEPFVDMNETMLREVVEADVGLYIGSSMRGLLSKWGPIGELAKQFDDQHLKYQFPPFEEDPNVMEGMGIYWREEADDD